MKTQILNLFTLVLLLSSCATHSGSVALTKMDSDVIFEDVAFGTSEATYFLGIGGLSRHTMVNAAKKQLYLNRPLKTGENYANLTVDIKHSFYIFASKQTVTVSADIIKDNTYSQTNRYSENYINTQKFKGLFSIGDQVMNDRYKQGIIERFNGNNDIVILFDDGHIGKESIHTIFNMKATFNGLTIGESFKGSSYSGKIVALGFSELIILNSKSELDIVFYKK